MALRPITYARDLLTRLKFRKTPTDAQRAGLRSVLAQESNGAAAAGEIGEVKETKVATGDAVSLTTATAANIGSITLTPGAWLVYGHANYNFGSATRTAASAGISTTSATLPTDGTEVPAGTQTTTTTHVDGITLTPKKILVAEDTTQAVYLVASATFSAGTATGWGDIVAIRVH